MHQQVAIPYKPYVNNKLCALRERGRRGGGANLRGPLQLVLLKNLAALRALK